MRQRGAAMVSLSEQALRMVASDANEALANERAGVQLRGARIGNVKQVSHDGPLVGRGTDAGWACPWTRALAGRLDLPYVLASHLGTLRGSGAQAEVSLGARTGPSRADKKLVRPPSRLRPHLDPPSGQAQPSSAPYQRPASPHAAAHPSIPCLRGGPEPDHGRFGVRSGSRSSSVGDLT